MKPIAEIFSQGEEVVCGQTVDSNAAWLSQQLNAQGLAVKRHTAVGDKLDDLVALLLEIAQRADCCICTGGLGPTVDDLTAAAVSQAFDLPLVLDETALAQIEQYYANRQRSMPAVNRKQALLPQGASRIDNPRGTAPGFSLRSQRCWFVFLPGVPSEMMAMFSATVLAQLPQQFCLQADIPISLRSIGIGESAIQQALHDWQPPEGVQLGFRATADEVQTKLVFAPFITAEQRLAISHAVADRIGDYVFAIDGVSAIQGSLLAVVDQYLQQQQLTVSVLETASHGLLTAKCLGMAGLVASELCLSRQQLATAWGVAEDLSLSLEQAEALAQQWHQQQQTPLALVQLYQADADAFTQPQQAITLYLALATPHGQHSRQVTVAGSAQHKQNQAALLSLDLLRRYLQNPCL